MTTVAREFFPSHKNPVNRGVRWQWTREQLSAGPCEYTADIRGTYRFSFVVQAANGRLTLRDRQTASPVTDRTVLIPLEIGDTITGTLQRPWSQGMSRVRFHVNGTALPDRVALIIFDVQDLDSEPTLRLLINLPGNIN